MFLSKSEISELVLLLEFCLNVILELNQLIKQMTSDVYLGACVFLLGLIALVILFCGIVPIYFVALTHHVCHH